MLQLSTTLPTSSGGSLTDNQSFCYDALSRLVWAGNTGSSSGGDHCGGDPGGSTTTGYAHSYSYDAMDRMTSGASGTVAYTDPSHVHAVTGLSTVPNQYASYDAMGNMTCRNTDTTGSQSCASGTQTGATMQYDNEGRLIGWTAPTGLTASDQFLYDNQGHRVLQRSSTGAVGNTTPTITDTITFDQFTDVTLTNGTSTVTNYYTVAGQRVAMRKGAILSYLVPDFLGSDNIALNFDGTVQAVQLFAPYGSVRYSDQIMPTDYSFTGQRLDGVTGLLYDVARYYDPVAGRFTTADIVQNNGSGMDPYAYVGNSPETRTDPTGHRPICGDFAGDSCGSNGGGGSSSGGGSNGGGGGSSLYTGGDILPSYNDPPPSSPPSQNNSSTIHDPIPSACESSGIFGCGYHVNFAIWLGPFSFSVPGNWSLSNEIDLGAGDEYVNGTGGSKQNTTEEEGILQALAPCEGGLSFVAATWVATKQGKQAIGTLKMGEKVWAYNPTSKKMELQPILHVWINHDNDLVDLTITRTVHVQHSKETKPANEVIHTNKKHPFLTVEKGFLPVGQIKLGMHVVEASGQVGVISGWKVVPGVMTMYNLEVQQDHTYTVGVGMWVVHNCNFDRNITNLEGLDNSIPGKLTKNPDLVDAGRSGGNRPLNGPASSYSHTTGGHALVYDNEGKLIYDIDSNRIKLVKIDTNPAGDEFPRDFKLYDAKGNLEVPPAWKSLLP